MNMVQQPSAQAAVDSPVLIEHGIDEVGAIESHGTDFIPESERHGKASELMWIWLSAQFSFGIIVIGSLPVVFGLGWWSSFTSLTVGIAIGSILYMPLALFGPRLGTNDPVASGAHFGVRGRLLASIISVFVGLGFYALTVWTGGQAVMIAANKLIGTSTSNTALGISMALVAVATVFVALYGHATLVLTYKVTTVVIGLLLLALILVQIPDFHASYKGGHYILGGFWSTWILAVSVGASLPISYSTFGGDYSRYFSHKTSGDRSIVFWNGLGMFISNEIALGLGAYLTTMFKDVNTPFVQGVASIVPKWFLVFVLLTGLLGTLPQGALDLYNAGLTMNTILWRLIGRAKTTVLLSAVGLVIVYIAVLVYNAIDSISAFVLIMNDTISPFMAVMLVGFFVRHGRYSARDVQPYAVRDQRGMYWFFHGINPRAIIAFVPAATIGFLFSATSLYTGPLANSASGIDLSYSSAFLIAAVLYFVLVKIFPEKGVIPGEAPSGEELEPIPVTT